MTPLKMYGARNPFLAMLAAINDEDKVEQPLNGAQQQQQRPGKVQLSEFGRRPKLVLWVSTCFAL